MAAPSRPRLMDSPPMSPRKGATQGATGATPNPSGEENFPKSDPTRRSAERSMREPSNVRPSDDPTPEKGTPVQKAGDGQAGDPDVQGA